MKKFLEIIKNKWLIKGTTTLLLVAIVIACYVLINYGVSKLNVEDIDCTSKKLYSLSGETKAKLKELDKDVTIQLINMKNSTYVTEYANKYSAVSKKINVEEIEDLSARVDLQTKYNIKESDSIIVVKSGEKEQELTINDLYTYDYTTYKQINRTEEAITNAIIEVTIEEKPHVYILSGKTYYNVEQDLAYLISKLEDESNEVDFVDILSTGEIPTDCNCLVITTLKQDLTEIERDKILEYINNGGKILIMTSQNMLRQEVTTPNFDKILEQYGITIDYGVILEQESAKRMQNSPAIIIEDVNASFMNDLDMKIKMCAVNAGKIQFANDEKLEELGVTYEAIAKTSESAFTRTNFEIEETSRTEQDGETNESIIGAYVNKKISDDKSSQLIIYSDETIATTRWIPISGYAYYVIDLYNNKDVVLNSIAHLTERNDTIVIRKTDEVQRYNVTEQEDVVIKTIIFVVPMLIIFIGIVVWIFRKRKV